MPARKELARGLRSAETVRLTFAGSTGRVSFGANQAPAGLCVRHPWALAAMRLRVHRSPGGSGGGRVPAAPAGYSCSHSATKQLFKPRFGLMMGSAWVNAVFILPRPSQTRGHAPGLRGWGRWSCKSENSQSGEGSWEVGAVRAPFSVAWPGLGGS